MLTLERARTDVENERARGGASGTLAPEMLAEEFLDRLAAWRPADRRSMSAAAPARDFLDALLI